MINTTSVYYEVACKFCQSVRNFFVAVFESMVEARQMQAYYEIAQQMSHSMYRLSNFALGLSIHFHAI